MSRNDDPLNIRLLCQQPKVDNNTEKVKFNKRPIFYGKTQFGEINKHSHKNSDSIPHNGIVICFAYLTETYITDPYFCSGLL